jgi:hypothetical protein
MRLHRAIYLLSTQCEDIDFSTLEKYAIDFIYKAERRFLN